MRVTATGVGHEFTPGTPLFEDLTFSAHSGQLWSVTGPSGVGKTTLLNLIAGWAAPTRGSIVIEDCDRMTWVLQTSMGVPGRTALDHVVLPLLCDGAHRPDAEAQAMKILDLFGLVPAARHSYRLLSGGECQRLMLARALARRPDLPLIDEPTAQLDSSNAHSVIDVLRHVADRGALTFVATHDPRVSSTCDQHIDLSR